MRTTIWAALRPPGTASNSPISFGTISKDNPAMLQRDLRTDLGVVQEDAVRIVELWEKLAVVDRQPEDRSYRLFFRTRLDTEIAGLCQNCGVRGKGRKELFFKPIKCQKCGKVGYYHIDYGPG